MYCNSRRTSFSLNEFNNKGSILLFLFLGISKLGLQSVKIPIRNVIKSLTIGGQQQSERERKQAQTSFDIYFGWLLIYLEQESYHDRNSEWRWCLLVKWHVKHAATSSTFGIIKRGMGGPTPCLLVWLRAILKAHSTASEPLLANTTRRNGRSS